MAESGLGMGSLPPSRPDYITISGRSLTMINVNVILSSLATLVVALRVFTRSRILRSVGVDDWLIMLGMLLAWILAVWSSIGAAWGLGRHIWDVPKESREGAGKIIWGILALYFPVLGAIKLSILCSLRRITPTAFNRRIIHTTMAAIVLITIAYTAATVFQCTPFRKIYGIDPDEPPIKGTCVDRKALFYSGAGINFISDVVILGIPVPMLWGLGFPKKQRIALVALFSMGGVACIASIARMVVIDQVIDTKDPTWEIHKHSITSCLEISLGIICASISSLKPFLARYTPHLFAGNARFLNQGSLTINSFGSGGAVQDNRPMSWYTEQRLAAAAAHGYRTIPDEESGVGASAGDVDVVGGPSISQDNTHSRHEPGQVLLRPEDDRPTTASTLNTTTSYASTLLPPTTPPSSLPFFPRNLTRKKKRLIPHKLTTSPNPIPTLPPSHHSSSSSGAMASRSPMKRIGEWGRDKIQTMMLTCSTPNTPVSDVQHSRARGRDSDSAILVLVPKGSTLGEEHEGLVLKMYVDDPVDSMEEEGEWLWEGERDREREMEPELEMERGKARGKSDKREDGPSKQRLWSATGAVRRKPVGGGTETLLPQHTHQESSLTSPSPSSSQESPMPRQPKFDTSPPPPPPAASKVPTAVPPSPLQFNVGATLNGPALDDYYYYY